MNAFTRAQIEKSLSAFLTQTCTIEARSGLDEFGAPAGTWTVIASNVRCRLIRVSQDRTSNAEQIGEGETLTETYRLITPRGTALALDQRVTLSGATYHVAGIVSQLTDAIETVAIVTRQRHAG